MKTKTKTKTLGLAIATVSLSAATLAWAVPEITIDFNGGTMTTTATAVDNVYVRIAGPNGFFTELRGTDIAQWSPDQNAPDGEYRYDSYSINTSGAESEGEGVGESLPKKSGTFSVNGGVIEVQDLSPPIDDEVSLEGSANTLQKALVATLDFFMPSANAAQLVSEDVFPAVRFRDTDFGASTDDDWATFAVEDTAGVGRYLVIDRLGNNNNFVMKFDGTSGSTNNNNSIVVNSNGDVRLANSRLFIDRNVNQMGLGTTSPQGSLHIMDSNRPEIVLQQTGNPNRWEFETQGNSANINVNSNRMFRLEAGATNDSLVINSDSSIGIGTSSPATTLHVKKSGAKMTVEDTSNTYGIRSVVSLKNKGPVGFKMEDTSSSDEWAFRSGGGGSFIVTKTGVSGPLISLSGTGSISMGLNPGSGSTASNMVLSSSGDLTIKGSFITPLATYADYVFAEDYKLMPLDQLQDFVNKEKHLPNVPSEAEVMKTKQVNMSKLQITQLEKIEELTLYTLQQHQQIKVLNERLDKQTMSLKAENSDLKKRLSSLEKLVTNIANANDAMTMSKGKLVASK